MLIALHPVLLADLVARALAADPGVEVVVTQDARQSEVWDVAVAFRSTEVEAGHVVSVDEPVVDFDGLVVRVRQLTAAVLRDGRQRTGAPRNASGLQPHS